VDRGSWSASLLSADRGRHGLRRDREPRRFVREQTLRIERHDGRDGLGPVAIAGTYFGSGLTYDNGRVFLLMFDGAIHAFNASSGAALWTTQLPGYWYEASPNAYGGIVFLVGNAGLSAVDEASGNILWDDRVGSLHRLGFACHLV